MAINKKGSFSVEGFRVIRKNPDGSTPTATRMLGFGAPVDLSSLSGSSYAADLTIKIDQAEQTKSVDFSAAATKTAVTVDEAVTAINAAAFTDITASKDAGTGRLKLVSAASGAVYGQVYGDLAKLLDFGDSIAKGGNGLKFVKCFDNTSEITLPLNVEDKTENGIESGDGTRREIVTEAKLKGMNPTATLDDTDYELLSVIQGGNFDETTSTYEVPTSDSKPPVFYVEVFNYLYDSGSNVKESWKYVEMTKLHSCTGIQGDITKSSASWNQLPLNLTATEYTDPDGKKWQAWTPRNLTKSEFEALHVETT